MQRIATLKTLPRMPLASVDLDLGSLSIQLIYGEILDAYFIWEIT
jgi:hypothetical protein